MQISFWEPLTSVQPEIIHFEGCEQVIQDKQEVRVVFSDGRTLRVARVVQDRHASVYAVEPDTYTAIHRRQAPVKPLAFHAMKVIS